MRPVDCPASSTQAATLGRKAATLFPLLLAVATMCASCRLGHGWLGTKLSNYDQGLSGKSSGLDFLRSVMRPVQASGVAGSLLVLAPRATQFSIYDNALGALVFLRHGERGEAAMLLQTLAQLQAKDGTLPFAAPLAEPRTPGIVRSGALAWVGYAAAVYLKDESGSGLAQTQIRLMAEHIADYLLSHLVQKAGDLRQGLILGGSGAYHYTSEERRLHEDLVTEPATWVSTEHNIDAFFFFHAMAEATHDSKYDVIATNLAKALRERLWSDKLQQFAQGSSEQRIDQTLALDCATWGGLALLAQGYRVQALAALHAAQERYQAVSKSGVQGYRPYSSSLLIDDPSMSKHYGLTEASNSWNAVPAVWPEGSAAVALLAWRLGFEAEAVSIVRQLETLRTISGGLPDLTITVPLAFSGEPSVAGTAWVELVRLETASSDAPQHLWSTSDS